MSSIQASPDLDQVKPEELSRYIVLFFNEILRVVNGGLDFQSNVDCKLLSITFSVADVDTPLVHNLKRVPSGYIVTSASAACSVYNGSSPNDSTTIVLRANAPATVGLLVF